MAYHQPTVNQRKPHHNPVVHSKEGVVASEDGRCSEIGVSMLEIGGNAVDAAIATTLALGVVSQFWSGIGGGDFIVIHEAGIQGAVTIDCRETAPAAASEHMYADKPKEKSYGPLSVAVPGKIAGLHAAWKKYGRLPWKTLFEPAIRLARNGFEITLFAAQCLHARRKIIKKDPGLSKVYAPNGWVLRAGEMCYNVKLAYAMEQIAQHGPDAFYQGVVGTKLVEDLKKGGGIITLDDLKQYKVRIKDALEVNTLGYTIYGMPPPSAGTVCLALILNILESYGAPDAFTGSLGLHRFIEALKHNFALRLNLGDPDFVDITKTVQEMLSPEFANKIRHRIIDTTTFPPEYYLKDNRLSPTTENGTSQVCVVDSERNVVSMTATVNYDFGSGVLSPSTGIIYNNEMDDFSIPTETMQFEDMPPPSPANYIRPGKRPLSSMTPIIIFKDQQLVGVLGASGGINITPGVAQVFINHFVHAMTPVQAVRHTRVYHRLIPNIVWYEDWTVVDDEHIELPEDKQEFLKGRNHVLSVLPGLGQKTGRYDVEAGSFCNFVVQNADNVLTGVSDIRKGGDPAAPY